jgi:hypothetical protein
MTDRTEYTDAVREQAFTDPHGRRIVHCRGRMTGADWDAEEVVRVIENAEEVQWVEGGGHDLAVLEGKMIWRFQVVRSGG